MRRSTLTQVWALAVLTSASFALGEGGTIASGGASFTILPAVGATRPTDFRPLGASGGNYLPEDFWAYNPGFSGVSFVGVTSETYNGNTATLTTNNGQTPGTITYTLNATANIVTLTSTFSFATTVGNVPNARVYHYGNVDVGGIATNTALLAAPGIMRITDGTRLMDFSAIAPNEYAAAANRTLPDAIFAFDGPMLANTGLPFAAGDYTGAFEWDVSLTKNVPLEFTTTYMVAVPEPATMSLLAGATMIAARRGRIHCCHRGA